ncbi:MAG TPA: hypothetical protein VIS09_03555 [Streptomyces sp.]|uniref:hypothetical protein n=1 Tax=Streptomyces sp. NBC_01358 TaxID=2903837 RepID=UPI002E336248|nr:hypothetical protein [Streptomyces sp. NBC_01358]
MTGPPDYYEYDGSRRVPRWLPKKTPTKEVGYEQPPDSGISVSAATDALQAAPDLDRFTEVFDHTVDDGHGAFAQMHQFLESAAKWCHSHGAFGAADELGLWAIRLEELIEDVRLLPESLSVEFAEAATRPPPAAAPRSPATTQPAAANVAKPASKPDTRTGHGFPPTSPALPGSRHR